MAQVLSIVDIYWGGIHLDIKPGSNLEFGGLVNKPVIAGKQVNRAVVMMESKISAKVIIKAGTDVLALFSTQLEQELTVICDTGQSYIWNDAFITETVKLTTGDSSEVDVNWAAGIPVSTVA